MQRYSLTKKQKQKYKQTTTKNKETKREKN